MKDTANTARLQAALAALVVAEAWMNQTIRCCEAENVSTFLPQNYPVSLKTVRRAIKMLRETGM